MAEYTYLVVGAGLFGSVFAREMAERGKSVLLVEKRHHIGGNIYTERHEGIDIHQYGAHIFHTSNENVWNYVQRFSQFLPFIHAPIANYKGEIFNLPFNMNTFSKMWNIALPQEAKAKIEEQRLSKKIPENLEEQALSLIGRDLYKKLIQGYTEKQWGQPCTALPKEIFDRLPIRYTYDNNYFNDRWQGIPSQGYTVLIKNMLSHKKIHLLLNTDYLKEKNALSQQAECIVYTGAIDSYFDYSFGMLEYRSLLFETEWLEMENYQGNAVVNFTDRETPYTRIIEHKHFHFENQKNTVITREYPEPWSPKKEAFYPIENTKNTALYRRYQSYADKIPHLIFGGRLGTYTYLNMDKVIENALQLAKKEAYRQG